MATLKEIKDRKKTVQSINKITSALKLVSTAKSKKLLNDLKKYEPFYEKMFSMMEILQSRSKGKIKSFLEKKPKDIWILFTSDMGLAGGFNSLLIKEFLNHYKDGDMVVVFGLKGKQLLNSKLKNIPKNNIETYNMSDFDEVISQDFLIKLFNKKDFNINIISNHYLNQITNEVNLINVIPLDEKKLQTKQEENRDIKQVMIFEPEIDELIDDLLLFYLESALNYCFKDSHAAEESARRNAMENATTNSDEMIKELSKQFNRIRQSKITQEISELISGTGT